MRTAAAFESRIEADCFQAAGWAGLDDNRLNDRGQWLIGPDYGAFGSEQWTQKMGNAPPGLAIDSQIVGIERGLRVAVRSTAQLAPIRALQSPAAKYLRIGKTLREP